MNNTDNSRNAPAYHKKTDYPYRKYHVSGKGSEITLDIEGSLDAVHLLKAGTSKKGPLYSKAGDYLKTWARAALPDMSYTQARGYIQELLKAEAEDPNNQDYFKFLAERPFETSAPINNNKKKGRKKKSEEGNALGESTLDDFIEDEDGISDLGFDEEDPIDEESEFAP